MRKEDTAYNVQINTIAFIPLIWQNIVHYTNLDPSKRMGLI